MTAEPNHVTRRQRTVWEVFEAGGKARARGRHGSGPLQPSRKAPGGSGMSHVGGGRHREGEAEVGQACKHCSTM